MSYDMASATDRAAATEASRQKIDEMLDDPFQPEDRDVHKLVKWIVTIFNLFLSYVQLAFYDFDRRIQELEDSDEDDEPSPSHRPFAAETTIPVPATTTQSATSALVRSRRRCAKCHTKGHDEFECRTKDPAANRRRVALNQRKKKEAARPPTYPFPVDPRFYSYAPPPPTVIPPEGYAALVADAHEFRRRNNQSTQDRRRARRSAAQPS